MHAESIRKGRALLSRQSQKLYSKEKPLKARDTSTSYEFEYEYDDKDEFFSGDKIWLDFYAGKKENMRKIPVYSVELSR